MSEDAGPARRTIDVRNNGRDATLAEIIEAIDDTAPTTKAELATELDLSQHYTSELIQELKAEGLVHKAYVVDEEAVYDAAPSVSELCRVRDEKDGARKTKLLSLLRRLDEVTTDQYRAARDRFRGETPEQSADQLEPLANERCMVVLRELKSFTLTTDWPGNRVASDVAMMARNLEIVGDRACYIADVVEERDTDTAGIVRERLVDVFDEGLTINDHMKNILFDCQLDQFPELQVEEEVVHRNLDELFELVTAYDPELYGDLVTITRSLERAIFYWVDTAELAVTLHSGVDPEHIRI